MFSLCDLERCVAQRARRLRGLRLAGTALSVGGLLTVGIICGYHLGLLPLHRFALSVVLGFPVLCAGLSYLLGRRRRPNLPRLLLKVDLAIGTEERLSALYELHRRGGGGVFRQRIEENLQNRSLPWKKGLPLRLSHLLPMGAGVITLVGATLLIAVPPAEPLKPVEEVCPSSAVISETKAALPSPEIPLKLPEEAGSPSPGPPSTKETPSHGLEDVLGEIWEIPAAGGILSEEEADLGEMIEEQRDLSRALSELLSRIKERLEEEQTSLTEAERRALAELLPQVGSFPLRQALRGLLEEEDPQVLVEQIKQALNLTATLALTSEEGPPRETSKGRSSTPEEGEGEQGFVWESQGRGEGPPEPGSGKDTESSEKTTSEVSSPDRDRSLAGEDEERFGGEEGVAGEVDPTAQAPGFIPFDLAGTIGESGEFQEFITKGVPLEPRSEPGKEATYLAVDYEVLRALLEERAIPPEAREVVRNYFQAITQEGGP